ncbi:hypothetical protein [Vibrio parahaemolyticus]|uniref:hypothetical protein n=1 Tax=Vibrio parahaemolyticus TaxID=670 RepID=UPI003005E590
MNLVGKHYIKNGYNCANFVSEWYERNLSIEIPVVNEFARSFVVWMRRHFHEIKKPENHCLVLMVGGDGTYHIGVYHNGGVWHNFKPANTYGSVVKWTLGSIRAAYSKVTFHQHNILEK